MNMRNILLVGLFCSFLVAACSRDTDVNDFNTISVDIDENKKIPGIEIVSIIPLETNDSSVIGEIDKLSFIDGNICILDTYYNSSLLLFDNRGNYINKTSVGRGPGELIRPHTYYIDHAKQQILVWEARLFKMVVYDYKLNHLYSKTHENKKGFKCFTQLPDSTWMTYSKSPNFNDPTGTVYNYFIYNKEFTQIKKELRPFDDKFIGVSIDKPIAYSDYPPLFTGNFDLKLYTLNENKQPKVSYEIDFGERTPSGNDLNKPLDEIFDIQKKGKIIANISKINENDDFICFHYPKDPALFYNFVIYSK